jgi:hypothetical protein
MVYTRGFGDAGLGFTPHVLLESDLVWHGLVLYTPM